MQKKGLYLKCDFCGNMVYKPPEFINQKHHFCNIECRDNFHHLKYKNWDTYWKLTIIKISNERKGRGRTLICKCECWNETKISIWNWGRIKSCWCLWWKTTHGMTNTSEYKIWRWLLDRCNKETHYVYRDYGGRWIKVRFKEFDEFYKEVWDRPWEWYSIDRIDNSKWYEPWNVRWATMKEQSNNRRSNVKCIIKWEEHTLQERADKLWMNRKTLKRYILKGKIKWDLYNYKPDKWQ